ncbi:unnamed protein product, partial [Iphiclides podalirius]
MYGPVALSLSDLKTAAEAGRSAPQPALHPPASEQRQTGLDGNELARSVTRLAQRQAAWRYPPSARRAFTVLSSLRRRLAHDREVPATRLGALFHAGRVASLYPNARSQVNPPAINTKAAVNNPH